MPHIQIPDPLRLPGARPAVAERSQRLGGLPMEVDPLALRRGIGRIAEILNSLQTRVDRLEVRVETVARFMLDTMVVAGHGWMARNAALAIVVDQTWRILSFNVATTVPLYCSFNVPLDEFTFVSEGTWVINLNMAMTFAEMNSSRNMEIRLVDVANPGVAVLQGFIPIGRNTDGMRYSAQVIADAVLNGPTDRTWRIEIKADPADTFTNVFLNRCNLTIYSVGRHPANVVIP